MDKEKPRLMSMKEIEQTVGVSRTKLWRMVRSGEIRSVINPRDRRERLLDLDEVLEALQPSFDEGKAAA